MSAADGETDSGPVTGPAALLDEIDGGPATGNCLAVRSLAGNAGSCGILLRAARRRSPPDFPAARLGTTGRTAEGKPFDVEPQHHFVTVHAAHDLAAARGQRAEERADASIRAVQERLLTLSKTGGSHAQFSA